MPHCLCCFASDCADGRTTSNRFKSIMYFASVLETDWNKLKYWQARNKQHTMYQNNSAIWLVYLSAFLFFNQIDCSGGVGGKAWGFLLLCWFEPQKHSANRLASADGVQLKTHHATANSSSPSRIMTDETRTSGHLLLDKTTDNIPDPAPLLHVSAGGWML